MRRRAPSVFTSRRWQTADGNPGNPSAVLGIPVAERIGTRADLPGALVRLADRRYAITGRTLAVGNTRQLDRYLQLRGRPGDDWYSEARQLLRGHAPKVSR